MTEDELRGQVKEDLKPRPAHLSWVESHATSAGFPDADICLGGTILQMELKVVKKGGRVEIRPTQYKWMKDRTRAGGSPVVLIGDDDCYYVMPGESIYTPCSLTNVSQLEGRTHYKVSTIKEAIDIALSIATEKGAYRHV